jgi:anaerobic selenocysteine-containing dehydrogenase
VGELRRSRCGDKLHHALPSLRKRVLHPEVTLHPTAVQARGIAEGDWVSIQTPDG